MKKIENIVMENEKEFKTRDFYISACILASGVTLLRLTKETEKFAFFVFNISPIKAEQIIQEHWDRKLMLPTRNLIEAIHELKTRIHATL